MGLKSLKSATWLCPSRTLRVLILAMEMARTQLRKFLASNTL